MEYRFKSARVQPTLKTTAQEVRTLENRAASIAFVRTWPLHSSERMPCGLSDDVETFSGNNRQGQPERKT